VEKLVKFREGFIKMASYLKLRYPALIIVSLIAVELLNQELSYDQFSDQVRYSYGEPFRHNGIPFAYGTSQMPLLKHFTLAFICASKVLTEDEFRKYCSFLFNPEKHSDALLEMRPLLSAQKPEDIKYETPGRDNKTIDWLIKYPENTLLLEVKNRTGSTYQHLIEIAQTSGMVSEPETNPKMFFKSTFSKFNRVNSSNVLQGAWIYVDIKENREKLDEYFDSYIDPDLMQFYIIGGWDFECYIKARNENQKKLLVEKFRIVESDRYVF